MKNILRIAVGAALLLGLAASMQPAEANCGAARAFTTLPNRFSTPGAPFGPNGYAVSPDFAGSFWSLAPLPGGGNPANALGNDSGALTGPTGGFGTPLPPGPSSLWIYPGFGGAGAYIGQSTGHWQTPGSDGCIDNDGSTGGCSPAETGQCMVALLTDDDQAGHGFFAVLAKTANTAGGNGLGVCDYDFSTLTSGDFQLAAVPKPEIRGSTRNGANSVDVSVRVSLPSSGFFLGCSPAQNAAIQAATAKLYLRQVLGHDTTNANPDRNKNTWVSASGDIPLNTNTTITLTCGGTDTDYYLCSTLKVPTGNGQFYELDNCSSDSLTIECGPNLAQPQERPRRTSPKSQAAPAPRGGRR